MWQNALYDGPPSSSYFRRLECYGFWRAGLTGFQAGRFREEFYSAGHPVVEEATVRGNGRLIHIDLAQGWVTARPVAGDRKTGRFPPPMPSQATGLTRSVACSGVPGMFSGGLLFAKAPDRVSLLRGNLEVTGFQEIELAG